MGLRQFLRLLNSERGDITPFPHEHGADGGGDSAIGMTLYNAQGNLVGQIMQSSAGVAFFRRQVQGGNQDMRLSVAFQRFGNVFQNELGRTILIGPTGDIIDDRILPQPARSAAASS